MSQSTFGTYSSYLNAKLCCKDASNSSSQTKSFIIEHPSDENKYLIHACLEGPESGVYYRGKSEIENNHSVTIRLPEYVYKFANDFTVNVTGIYDGKIKTYNCSDIGDNGIFTVYGENGRFNWTAIGKRGDIIVEANKTEVNIKGDGPYRWYEI